jgi:phospholipid transport system substrate-binding protein
MKLIKKQYFSVFIGFFAIAFAIVFATSAVAATPSPMDMLQSTSSQMIAELNADKATLKSNPNQVFDIVHRILLPHADMSYMAKSVVGRAAWNSASSSDQQAFIQQFTELLIRTYASALASYTNQTVEFSPIRGGWEGQNQIQVQSRILQPGGPDVPMTYRLLLENQSWKLVDFSVDNVSLVENFRAQFANDLNQGGLANLTAKLKQHNANLAANQNQNS